MNEVIQLVKFQQKQTLTFSNWTQQLISKLIQLF